MSVPAGHVARLAVEFWLRAGGAATYPRDPEPLLSLALPLAVRALPDLTAARVRDLAALYGFPDLEASHERALRGCLIAFSGRGMIIVDPRDPPPERR